MNKRTIANFADPIVIVGVIISVALIFLSGIFGINVLISIQIGLISIIITLLIDLIGRLNKTERNLSRIQELQIDTADEWLLEMIIQMMRHYNEAKKQWENKPIQYISKRVLTVCLETLKEIEKGSIELPRIPTYVFDNFEIREAQKSICAVSQGKMHYWETPRGDTYWKENEKAIERGVEITRIFFQPQKDLDRSQSQSTLQQQINRRVGVYTLDSKKYTHHEHGDYLILDDNIVVVFDFKDGDTPQGLKVIAESDMVKQYKHWFKNTLQDATKLSP